MEQRVYHGPISPQILAQNLIACFNRGNYHVHQIGNGDQMAVQITTNDSPASGGQTALTVTLQSVEDGVSVQVGNQALFGVAASLGWTALSALRNPFSLLGRLDDLAQDIESMQLSDEVWKVIDGTAQNVGASHELSERLRRLVCSYCQTANPVGRSNCLACGAPLGEEQPQTCPNCGFVLTKGQTTCPNCNRSIS